MFKLIVMLVWTGGYFYGANWLFIRLGGAPLFSPGQGNKILMTLPIWLIGVFMFGRLFKRKHSEKLVQQAVTDHPFVPVKGFVPHAMPSQGKSSIFTPTPTPVASPAVSTPDSVQSAVPQASVPSSEPVITPNMLEKQAVDTITKMAEEKNLTPFPHVLLQNIMIPLTVSADIKAILMNFLSLPGTWQVEEKENLAESIWTNGATSVPMLKKVIEGRRILSEMEPDAEVVSALVLVDGEINQEEHIKEYLEKENIKLVRLNSKENSTLKTISQLFDEEFIPQPEEEIEGEEVENV